mgnify:CR=1 FL=1
MDVHRPTGHIISANLLFLFFEITEVKVNFAKNMRKRDKKL